MVWQQENRLSYEDFLEKYRTVLFIFVGLFLLLSLRLFQLQVILGGYFKNLSEQQRTQLIVERAPRGNIYDTSGKVLVGNKTTFVALYYPFYRSDDPSKEIFKKLEKATGDQEITRKIMKGWENGQVVRLSEDIKRPEMFKLLEQRLIFPGISVIKEAKREYIAPEANAHLNGYLSEITKKELDVMAAEGFKMGDWLGRRGLEQIYDNSLKGDDGGWQIEVDAYGHQTKLVRHIPSVQGDALYTTIDARLQETAYNALKASPSGRGAVVGIDPRNGAIRILVSSPGYDPNISFMPEFGKFIVSKELPMFNRAVQGLYPPGSTFKIITFISGLNERKISKDQTFNCTGSFTYGNKTFACWEKKGHGRLNLIEALARSCNVYFYQLGLKVGQEIILDYARKFELGKATGVEVLDEKSGLVPSEEWKKKKLHEAWHPGDTINIAIGQGPLWVTPIQMAQMISIVANRGAVYQLHILDKIVSPTGEVVVKYEPKKRAEVTLADDVWGLIGYGLEEVVLNGTARACYFQTLRVAAKTGTAQNPQGKDHAWIVGYAPVENPQLAICVIVENGGGGGAIAGPVARAIFEEYFITRNQPVINPSEAGTSIIKSTNPAVMQGAASSHKQMKTKNSGELEILNLDN
jgi:penicillin-binding protein 2